MSTAGALWLLLLLRPVFELLPLFLMEPGAYVPSMGVHEWRISAALILGGLTTGAVLFGRGVPVPRVATGAMVLWIGMAAASVWWSVDRGTTVRQTFELAALGSVWWTAVQLAAHPRWRRAGLMVILAGVGAMCVAGLYQYFYLLERIRVEAFAGMTEWIGAVAADRLYSNRIYATFISPSVFGDYLAVLLPIVVGGIGARWSAERRGRALAVSLLAVVLGALAVWCLVLTTARGAWLATAVGVSVLLLWQGIRKVAGPRSAAAAVLLVACLLVLPTHAQDAPASSPPTDFREGMDPKYFTGGLPTLQDLLNPRTLGMRATYWRSTLAMIRAYPAGGLGWGAWAAAYPRYTVRGGWPTELAHNNYLQVLAELGPLGLWCFVTLLATAVRGGVRHARSAATAGARWIWAGATCGVIAFAVHSLTDYALYMPAVAWPVFAILGALHSAPESAATSPAPRRRPVPALLVAAVTLVALALWQPVADARRGVRLARLFWAEDRLPDARDVAVRAGNRARWDGEAAVLAGRLVADEAANGAGPGWQVSLDLYARAVRRLPLSPWVREGYADVLWRVGRTRRDRALLQESLRQRQAAVANYPVHPELHARLAEAARAMGDMALATRHEALAEELRPHYHEALDRE